MTSWRIALCALALFGAACGHVAPATTAGVPPPWPAPDPPVVEKAEPAPPPAPAPKIKPPVPPLKQDLLPPASPTPPKSK
jgi:hypothetical protein